MRFESLEARWLMAADFELLAPVAHEPRLHAQHGLLEHHEHHEHDSHHDHDGGIAPGDSTPDALVTLSPDFDGHYEPAWGSFSNLLTLAWDTAWGCTTRVPATRSD